MGEVLPLPSLGDVFADIRGEERTLRISYHADRGVVVISLWVGALCRGSFRMAAGDVHRFISVLDEIRLAGGPTPSSVPEVSPPPPEASVEPAPPEASVEPPTEAQESSVITTGDVTGAAHASRSPLATAPLVA